MGCCGQNTTGAGAAAVDTGKRVNYTKGMLLGVDDFVQDQAYEIAHRHELARELLGYGTVRGLQVIVEDDAGGPRVRVTPGMAWLPSGKPVCVPSEQCCSINDWLLKHEADYASQVSGSSAALALYVVLAYAECLTDKVPIPGEPCRSEDELMQDSRIADCFRLELRLAPPAQIEEDAVRDFADWLAKVPVDSSSPPLSESAFMDQLRAAAQAWLVPTSPHPGDFMFGSPPAGLGSDDLLLRAALRLWVTELRPLWRARYGCGPDAALEGGSDDAVLLAALGLNLVKGGHWEADGAVAILEDERPVLLSLRMVQELITQNPAPEPAHSVEPAQRFGQGSWVGADTAYARADHSHGTPPLSGDAEAVEEDAQRLRVTGLNRVPLDTTVALADDQVLTVATDGAHHVWRPRPQAQPGAVTAQQLFNLDPSDGADSTRFARADHTHGTPALSGDAVVDAGGDVESLRKRVVRPPGQNVRVTGLNRVPLDTTPPSTAGQVLTYGPISQGGLGWSPKAPPAVPLAGDTVTSQQRFSLEALAGTAATFSRSDHSHGTPTLSGDVEVKLEGEKPAVRIVSLQGKAVVADSPKDKQVLTYDDERSTWRPADPAGGGPAPAASAPKGLAFGIIGAVGEGTEYARSDHSHTLPELPPLPGLGGDLSRTIGDAYIARLQSKLVKADSPNQGDLLMFDGEAWVPDPGEARIVAAGEVKFRLYDGQLNAAEPPVMTRSLGGLSVRATDIHVFGFLIRVDLHALPTLTAPAKPGYIVKVTPTLPPNYLNVSGSEAPQIPKDAPLFFAFAAAEVAKNHDVAGQIDLSVILYAATDLSQGTFGFTVQIEVTRFGVA